MMLSDWTALGLLALFSLLGMLFGFGKGLKFFTGGILGAIISIIVCYAVGGIIYNFGFVQTLLEKFRAVLESNGSGVCNFLLKIRIDIVVYYVALFIAVTIIRLITVKIVKSVVEINNVVLIIINKMLGVIFFICVLLLLMFIAFWIISLIGGSTQEWLYLQISGSKLKIDWLYEHNPLMTIIKAIRVEVPAN